MSKPSGISRRRLVSGVTAGACLMLTAGTAFAASSPSHRRRLLAANPKPVPPFTPIQTPASAETLQVLISIKQQSMKVFSGQRQIGFSPISSGKPGKETPHGIFSVLRKHKFRWSNLYVQEPMPFMQRLTWSGIALHAGELPGYPASHGCIRMPDEFAKQLFDLETSDRHVVIADTPAKPVTLKHTGLLKPASTVETRKYATLASTPPLRVLLTRLTGREKTLNGQKILNKLGFEAGKPDGYVGRKTWRAIHNFQKSIDLPANGVLNDATYHALRSSNGAEDYPEGHLYVRQGYKPLFDIAIPLKDAEQ
ncbi:MAG: L,D-transpeptidase family protein, partial [Pseudomonadota bacterium]